MVVVGLNGSKMTDYGAEAEAAANYFVKNRHEVEKAVETIVENIEKKQNNS